VFGNILTAWGLTGSIFLIRIYVNAVSLGKFHIPDKIVSDFTGKLIKLIMNSG
jgi:hypothetical protein